MAKFLLSAIQSIVYRWGKTNTAAALEYLRNTAYSIGGVRPGIRQVALIVTDGESANRSATLQEARMTKTSGIHVISLGIGTYSYYPPHKS